MVNPPVGLCIRSLVTVVFLMLKYNFTTRTTRNYLEVSNNRDCGKVHKKLCQQEYKLLSRPKEAIQNKTFFFFFLVY